MMDLTDLEAANETVTSAEWVDIEKYGIRLLVKGTTSPAVIRAYRRLARRAPISDRLEDGQLTPEAETEITRKSLANEAVFGWEGITVDGAELPFSRENAAKLLSNDLFLNIVEEAAMVVATRDAIALEDLVKN